MAASMQAVLPAAVGRSRAFGQQSAATCSASMLCHGNGSYGGHRARKNSSKQGSGIIDDRSRHASRESAGKRRSPIPSGAEQYWTADRLVKDQDGMTLAALA